MEFFVETQKKKNLSNFFPNYKNLDDPFMPKFEYMAYFCMLLSLI